MKTLVMLDEQGGKQFIISCVIIPCNQYLAEQMYTCAIAEYEELQVCFLYIQGLTESKINVLWIIIVLFPLKKKQFAALIFF